MLPNTLSITVHWNRSLCASTQLGQQDRSQPQKADDLHEKEPEAYGCNRVGLNEAYVHQGLHDAGNENRDCQRIHKAAGHVSNVSAKTIAPKTGRFSTQFACARIARLYQSAPSI